MSFELKRNVKEPLPEDEGVEVSEPEEVRGPKARMGREHIKARSGSDTKSAPGGYRESRSHYSPAPRRPLKSSRSLFLDKESQNVSPPASSKRLSLHLVCWLPIQYFFFLYVYLTYVNKVHLNHLISAIHN